MQNNEINLGKTQPLVSRESTPTTTQTVTEKPEHPDTKRFKELQSLKQKTGGFNNEIDRLEFDVLRDRMSGPFVTKEEIPYLRDRQNNAGIGNNPPLTDIETVKIQKINREDQFQKAKELRS